MKILLLATAVASIALAGCVPPVTVDPEPAVTTVNFGMTGTGSVTGTGITGTISLAGTATLDLLTGDLTYSYTDAVTDVNSGAFLINTDEQGTVSGAWSEPVLSAPTEGSGTMTDCVDSGSSTTLLCPQFLTAAEATEFPIATAIASSIADESITFNLVGGDTVFTVNYTSPTADGSAVSIEFTLSEQ